MKSWITVLTVCVVAWAVFGAVSASFALGYQLGDRVWQDLDGQGDQDADEPGIPGAVVTLTQSDAGIDFVATTVTDDNGMYLFDASLVGVTVDVISPTDGTWEVLGTSATVTVELPTDFGTWVCTYDLDNGTVAPDGIGKGLLPSLEYDFGYMPRGTDERPFTTYTQGGWGAKPHGSNPGALLWANWDDVFPDGFTVGAGTHTITFLTAADVTNFLPQGGTPRALTGGPYVPPLPKRTEAGVFAGQVVAMRLSVSFSRAGLTRTGLDALRLQSGPCAGMTVADFLALCEKALGGVSTGYTISQLNAAATAFNECFDDGGPGDGFLAP